MYQNLGGYFAQHGRLRQRPDGAQAWRPIPPPTKRRSTRGRSRKCGWRRSNWPSTPNSWPTWKRARATEYADVFARHAEMGDRPPARPRMTTSGSRRRTRRQGRDRHARGRRERRKGAPLPRRSRGAVRALSTANKPIAKQTEADGALRLKLYGLDEGGARRRRQSLGIPMARAANSASDRRRRLAAARPSRRPRRSIRRAPRARRRRSARTGQETVVERMKSPNRSRTLIPAMTAAATAISTGSSPRTSGKSMPALRASSTPACCATKSATSSTSPMRRNRPDQDASPKSASKSAAGRRRCARVPDLQTARRRRRRTGRRKGRQGKATTRRWLGKPSSSRTDRTTRRKADGWIAANYQAQERVPNRREHANRHPALEQPRGRRNSPVLSDLKEARTAGREDDGLNLNGILGYAGARSDLRETGRRLEGVQ